MTQVFANGLKGTTTTSPLASGGTSLVSANFASLPAIASPSFMYLVLDPLAVAGAPELIIVTAHTALSTTATITRGAQGSTARAHLAGTEWRHTMTKSDLDELPFRRLNGVGSMLYAGAVNATAELGIGAEGALMSVVGGVPSWTSPAWVADLTVAWTAAAGTAPDIGSGAVALEQQRIGKTMNFWARLLFAADSTYGSGSNAWRISIPGTTPVTVPPQRVEVHYVLAGSAKTAVVPGSSAGLVATAPTNSSYIDLGGLSAAAGAWQANDYVMVNGTIKLA